MDVKVGESNTHSNLSTVPFLGGGTIFSFRIGSWDKMKSIIITSDVNGNNNPLNGSDGSLTMQNKAGSINT